MTTTTAIQQLIDATELSLESADGRELARMAKHEYDDEAAIPPEASLGETFLRNAAAGYVNWLRREGRFPADHEVDEVATTWHRTGMTAGMCVTVFADLGLVFSAHADAARGASHADFLRVLDSVAVQFAFTLTQEYAPLPG